MPGYKIIRRKHFMTLLETLIAASLLSVLLVIIFGFFRELSVMSIATEQKQRENFRSRYLEARLSSVFDRIVNERDRGRTFFFYTRPPDGAFSSSTSLIFTFDNGIGADPLYSGDVLGRLYLDNSKVFDSSGGEPSYRLVLAVWPLHIEHPEEYLRKEVLSEGITEMQFEFYAAPEHLSNAKAVSGFAANVPGNTGGGILSASPISPEKNRWHENIWSIEYNQMPSIVKITLHVKKRPDSLEKKRADSNGTETLMFTFVLPSSKHPVHYPADVLP